MTFMTQKKTHPDRQESRLQALAQAKAKAMNQAMAQSVLSPEFSASVVVTAYAKSSSLDQISVMEQLQAQHASLATGNLAQAENMLMSQAVALQTVFTSLAARAVSLSSAEQMQGMLGLALRAQSGSRATLQALGELKNPRHATFVKQANIAHGPQQVNNGAEPTRTMEEIEVSTNKLSGAHHELLEDTRAPGQAIAGHPGVAAVEKVHRAKVRRG
ncbi:hypothetical protein [Polaromonas sp. CG9_12]|nr:hypothetical protein [Polaromonas sp. CG9_12]